MAAGSCTTGTSSCRRCLLALDNHHLCLAQSLLDVQPTSLQPVLLDETNLVHSVSVGKLDKAKSTLLATLRPSDLLNPEDLAAKLAKIFFDVVIRGLLTKAPDPELLDLHEGLRVLGVLLGGLALRYAPRR